MKTIAVFLAGQAGDIMEASSVLRYRNELWGDAKIVWYIDDANRDLLAYQDIELRTFPRGFGYPEMVIEENKKLVEQGKEPIWEDWLPLVDENNHMNLELKKNYPSLADIDYGYFPAPHQVDVVKRHNVTYPDVSRKVFGIPDSYEWHPCLEFVEEDYDKVESFLDEVGKGKIVFIETFAGSGQSLLDEEMVMTAMDMCDDVWPDCKFVFGSHKFLRNKEAFPEHFFENINVYSCKDFTVRQCALIAGSSDLIISVSSGITVAASCWYNKPVPTLQFTGSSICGTKALALGEIVQVFADDRTIQSAKQQFYNELTNLLNKYK
jgi:hypothetical protein